MAPIASTRRRLVALPVLALVSCASPTVPVQIREEPAHTRGTVTSLEMATPRRTFLVEAQPNADIDDKYIVTVDDRTRIFRRTAPGDTVRAGLQDIVLHSIVAVWFDGPVLESYPAQGVAKYVLVDSVILDHRSDD